MLVIRQLLNSEMCPNINLHFNGIFLDTGLWTSPRLLH